MFCPQCGSAQDEDLKFCKLCGANLHVVRQAVATQELGGNIDWGKTWVAEMFLSEGERKRRREELERLRGVTPDVKRYNEIKAGVITGCVGLAVSVVLFVLTNGIILSGKVTPGAAEILSCLWIAGVIPLFVGVALVINGLFVSKKLVELARQESRDRPNTLDGGTQPQALRSADTSEFIAPGFSVTEETTMHLKGSGREQ